MNKQYISVHYKTALDESGIVAALLLNAGYDGVDEQEEETIASIQKDLFDEAWLRQTMLEYGIEYSIQTIESQNWNAKWEESFEPVIVGPFAAIRASFHEAIPAVQHDVIITPKMSFGTGHHATTFLMIEQMETIDFSGKIVIDFGTGTGVLAILAEKLGAGKIVATDNDEWSIANAQENIQANNCHKIELLHADNLPKGLPKADILLANINLNVILANLDAIVRLCHKQSIAVFSGLMTADESIIKKALTAKGLNINKVLHKAGWICLYTTCEFSVD